MTKCWIPLLKVFSTFSLFCIYRLRYKKVHLSRYNLEWKTMDKTVVSFKLWLQNKVWYKAHQKCWKFLFKSLFLLQFCYWAFPLIVSQSLPILPYLWNITLKKALETLISLWKMDKAQAYFSQVYFHFNNFATFKKVTPNCGNYPSVTLTHIAQPFLRFEKAKLMSSNDGDYYILHLCVNDKKCSL